MKPSGLRYVYLHGFASSPGSRKAQAFAGAMAARGVNLEIPILDGGDFEHLTITGQLKIVEQTLHGDPACLVGSSMGGYLAALYASEHPEVARVCLMAPAFGFAERWKSAWPDPVAGLDVFHYGEKRTRRVHYGLLEDALLYPAYPSFDQPGQIFHGTKDDVVPVEFSRQFVAAHGNAILLELDSDHELTDALERIIEVAAPFLTDF